MRYRLYRTRQLAVEFILNYDGLVLLMGAALAFAEGINIGK